MPTYQFYLDTYGGDLFADATEFQRYANKAYLLLNLYCNGNLDKMSADNTIKTAVCFQADFLMINGYEMSIEGITEGGFTVGKVRVDSGTSDVVKKSGWLAFLSPLALNMLASIGARHLGVAIEPFVPYPWGW